MIQNFKERNPMQVSFTSLVGLAHNIENTNNINSIKRAYPDSNIDNYLESAFAKINLISGKKDIFLKTTENSISITNKDGNMCYAATNFDINHSKEPNDEQIKNQLEKFTDDFETNFKDGTVII